jgi:hypothetical protein
VIDGERGLRRLPTAPKETAPLSNALDPGLMTAAERLAEIGEILARGILRLRARDSGRPPANAETIPWTSPPTRASMAGKNKPEKNHN